MGISSTCGVAAMEFGSYTIPNMESCSLSLPSVASGSYVSSATKGGTVTTFGAADWAGGSVTTAGAAPFGIPGEKKNARFYCGPGSSGTLGQTASGVLYSGTIIIKSVDIDFDCNSGAPMRVVTTFEGSGALTEATGVIADGNTPTALSIFGATINTGVRVISGKVHFEVSTAKICHSGSGGWQEATCGPLSGSCTLVCAAQSMSELTLEEGTPFNLTLNFSNSTSLNISYFVPTGAGSLELNNSAADALRITIESAWSCIDNSGQTGSIALAGKSLYPPASSNP